MSPCIFLITTLFKRQGRKKKSSENQQAINRTIETAKNEIAKEKTTGDQPCGNTSPPARILLLPNEILHMIFRHIFVFGVLEVWIHPMKRSIPVSIFRVCKVFQEEAAYIFYSRNTFYPWLWAHLSNGSFLQNIGPTNCANITSFYMYWLQRLVKPLDQRRTLPAERRGLHH